MVIELGTGKIVNSKAATLDDRKDLLDPRLAAVVDFEGTSARNPHKMMVNTIALKTGLYWESNGQLTKTLSS
ncbi:hypothetical protein [Rhodopseudomonas palustris]|uniref:hypothetical protein n=1 Tax=Rhodopseudomonas palustris TaxID=1076 RepID=UPI001F3C904C|nr:hypothetical protein [Rhodopseudomonas palustris]